MPIPQKIRSLILSEAEVPANTTATGRVMLTIPAARPFTVALASSDPAVADVPASVVIPPHRIMGEFLITTRAVTISKFVTITARGYGAGSKTVSISITPADKTPTDTELRRRAKEMPMRF